MLQVTFRDKTANTESLLNEDGIELVESLSNSSVVITLRNRDAVWLNKLLLDRGYQWFPEIWKMIVVSLIYCFAAFTAGLIIFAKRDLNG